MDPTVLNVLFRAPSISKGIAEFLGIVESIGKRIERLEQSHFNAGVRCLREHDQARHQQEFLLKEAWHHFHGALTTETAVRKALAYVGLAFCQECLGEQELATETLRELSEYSYSPPSERLTNWGWETFKVYKGGRGMLLLLPFMGVTAASDWASGRFDAASKVSEIASQALELVGQRAQKPG